MQGIMFLVGGGVGFFGSKALTQMVMTTGNTGVARIFRQCGGNRGNGDYGAYDPAHAQVRPGDLGGRRLASHLADSERQHCGRPARVFARCGRLPDAELRHSAKSGCSARFGSDRNSNRLGLSRPGRNIHGRASRSPGVRMPWRNEGYNTQGFGHSMYSSQGLYS